MVIVPAAILLAFILSAGYVLTLEAFNLGPFKQT